jgi:hypothetical protein
LRTVPTEIVFASGGAVKVMAAVDDVAAALAAGDVTVRTNRFAGFRGDEAVAGEVVVLRVPSIAYAIAISAP